MNRYLTHPLGYLWAAPNTVLGLMCMSFAILARDRVQYRNGVLEVYGDFAAWFLWNIGGGVGAMTLGHVILARDRRLLAWTRNHEHVHVGQCARWGPFFLPMYGLSSFLCWWKGLNPYMENRFEKVAYELHPCHGWPPEDWNEENPP